jgi:ABC-type branched-subunit amino acid transport system substrate-binding protein
LVAALVTLLGPALGGCVIVKTVPATPAPPQAPLPAEPEPAPAAPTPPEVPSKYPGKTDVALLLPQSGPNAALGLDMIDAAELAMADLASDSLVLTPKDTQSTAEGAADAARSAIADGARLIVGPLTAAELEYVAPLARSAGVAVLSFSNQTRVAGDGVYVLGFLPQEEAKRVASYALSTGIQQFAVLAPSTAYGQLTASAFGDAVASGGGKIDQTQFYEPNSVDPKSVAQSLGAEGPPQFRALLLPEYNPDKLKSFAAALAAANVGAPGVRLLGTDTWDTPGLGAEPSLVGGWFAAPPDDARVGFEQRFRKAYGHQPKRLATLAYDAVGIAAVLQKVPGNVFDSEALTNPSGFVGADGILRLRPDGTSERGLAVMEIKPDGAVAVSPAPQGFQSVSQ